MERRLARTRSADTPTAVAPGSNSGCSGTYPLRAVSVSTTEGTGDPPAANWALVKPEITPSSSVTQSVPRLSNAAPCGCDPIVIVIAGAVEPLAARRSDVQPTTV
jgi:hypothetical protein